MAAYQYPATSPFFVASTMHSPRMNTYVHDQILQKKRHHPQRVAIGVEAVLWPRRTNCAYPPLWLELIMPNPFFDHPILNSPYACPPRHWSWTSLGNQRSRLSSVAAGRNSSRQFPNRRSAGAPPNKRKLSSTKGKAFRRRSSSTTRLRSSTNWPNACTASCEACR